jgi:beta-glucosidase/6-phospho-beta-glucosidase/beta-galactosidase
MQTLPQPTFKSFFWSGYECTAARAENRKRLNLLQDTRHDVYCRQDYQMIKELGIQTVREGLNWSRIDHGNNHYDFSLFESIMHIGKEEGIQQIWDLNHFDYPDYLDPFTETFIIQFAEYAKHALAKIRKYQDGVVYIAPVNEPSFFAWIAADRGYWAPYTTGSANGEKMKKQLVKANIKAMEALWSIDQNIRFIHIDPFMRRIPKEPASPYASKHCNEFNNVFRYEGWDMIAGKTYPELGGDPKYLDIIGVNYYIHNQEWCITPKNKQGLMHRAMAWTDPHRIPFGEMLQEIYDRYQRPMVISETGSFGDKRARWWQRTLKEIDTARKKLPIYGVCSYPTVDRPDWANFLLPNSGLWDFEKDDVDCRRIPHTNSLQLIKDYSALWQSTSRS